MRKANYYAIKTANSTYYAERIGKTERFHVMGPVDSFELGYVPHVGSCIFYDGYLGRKRTTTVRSVIPMTKLQWQAT